MNEQAEEILLGSILIDNSILEEVTLSPNHFLEMTNQNLFKAMIEIKRKGFPIDGASLKDHMGETGFLFVGGNERLQAYKETVPSVHSFKSYEQMIINQYKISTAKDLMRTALDGELNVDLLQMLIKDLNKVDEEGILDDFNLKEQLKSLYEAITVEPPKKQSGIPSGYVDIDKKTDGFQPADLVIVGARPSMGKTAFILNLAINANAKGGAIPIIFSLEMTTQKLMQRMQSCIAEVNGMKLKNPYHYATSEEKEKLIKALKVLKGIAPFIYDKPGQKVSEMRAKVRKIKQANPGKDIIVLIDYMTKIRPSKDHKGNMHQEITEISEDLKEMAKIFQ